MLVSSPPTLSITHMMPLTFLTTPKRTIQQFAWEYSTLIQLTRQVVSSNIIYSLDFFPRLCLIITCRSYSDVFQFHNNTFKLSMTSAVTPFCRVPVCHPLTEKNYYLLYCILDAVMQFKFKILYFNKFCFFNLSHIILCSNYHWKMEALKTYYKYNACRIVGR